jgi:hypothetical protein
VLHLYFAADSWFASHWNDVGTIVSISIAFVAAFRPELHSFLRPRKIDVLLTDSYLLEIGFADFGPTLGIVGTINNEHARSVINKLRIHLWLPENAGEYVLSPVYNRVLEIGSAFAGGADVRGTLWLPFLVEDDVAVSFNVLFRNDAVNSELASISSRLGQAWMAFATENAQTKRSEWEDADANAQDEKLAKFGRDLYDRSMDAPFIAEARAALTGIFVWRTGQYRARLEVEVLNCKRVFSESFTFSIPEEDRFRLSFNINTLIAMICQPLRPNAAIQTIVSPIKLAD